jgi:hypothetical protein
MAFDKVGTKAQSELSKSEATHKAKPAPTQDGLLDAAAVLDDLAAGISPDRTRLLSGVHALDALRLSGNCHQDVLEAAVRLESIKKGGIIDLDDPNRRRATVLAAGIRAMYRPPGIP